MYKKIPLKSIIEGISTDKSLSDPIVFSSIKNSFLNVVKKKYNILNVNIILDENKDILIFSVSRVVKNFKYNVSIKNSFKKIPFKKALYYNDNIKVGENIKFGINSLIFFRNEIKEAKFSIIKNVKHAEKEYRIKNLKSKIGNLIIGKVIRVFKDFLLIDIDDYTEGVIKKDNLILKDFFKKGDKIKACVIKVFVFGERLILELDRTCNDMLRALLFQEIPEIKENLIEVKDIARNPGIRSKISIISNNQKLDLIKICSGVGSLRLNSVSKELCGEKIEVMAWDENIEFYIKNVFSPANILALIIDKVSKFVTLTVEKEDFLKLIGKKGQNIKLINRLVRWNLKIKTI